MQERPQLWFWVGLISLALGVDLVEHMIVGRVTMVRVIMCIPCFGVGIPFSIRFLRWAFRKPRPQYLDRRE